MINWIKRLAVVFAAALTLTAGAATVPAQVLGGPVVDRTIVVNGVVWEHVSAEQNLIDQKRQAAEVKAGLRKTTYKGCPDNTWCLYQWQNYGGDRWQSSLQNVWNSGCISLTSPMAYWDNGTQVYDNSGSMVVNQTGGWGNYRAYIYNWVSCNSGGGSTSAQLGPGPGIWEGNFINGHWWYHKISSLDMAYVG